MFGTLMMFALIAVIGYGCYRAGREDERLLGRVGNAVRDLAADVDELTDRVAKLDGGWEA